MKYAVLDWDNTIRKGYTIFSFVDFLISESVLPWSVKQSIDEWDQKYRSGQITHDQYAQYACQDFADSLSGHSVSSVNNLVKEYIRFDRQNLFSFSKTLFDFLHKYDIAPIVISGAPLCVIREYREEFHIQEIYAFEVSQHLGKYTGAVNSNYGYGKDDIISELIKKYRVPPFMGFGDSSSDYPLMQASQYGFCIGKDYATNSIANTTFISQDATETDISPILLRCL